MRRRVIWTPAVRARLRHAHPSIKRELNAVAKYIDGRWRADVKLMQGVGELYSLRVGGWRVILRPLPGPGEYEVEDFGPREVIYDNYPRPSDD